MKTAISVPDPLFDSADRLAERLGLSRSELYQRADPVRARIQEASLEADLERSTDR